MDQKIHTKINQMSRKQIVKLLESYGFACYDREPTSDLREALRANVQDGTIPTEAL